MSDTSAALLTQLRALHELTKTEVQIAETRTAQARTDAVRRELTQNAANGRARADAIERAIRSLGGLPSALGPVLGRAVAVLKASVEQTQPLQEAILGDLALEHRLLDRSRYLKALAHASSHAEITTLADRLIQAHSATVDWLTTVLAEDALGGPTALRRTPIQMATAGVARAISIPTTWTEQGLNRAVDAARSARPRIESLLSRGAHVGETAEKMLSASRDSALESAESVVARAGLHSVAGGLHDSRDKAGVLSEDELPISDYSTMNVSTAVEAIKQLDDPADIRTVLAFEEAHKNRHGVVSAAQTRFAALAKDIVGIDD